MFDRIAKRYDLMNTVMTAGLHDEWRERAADVANVGPGSHVLDVATGTGDLAIELAKRVSPGGSVTGADFSEEMLVGRAPEAALRAGRRRRRGRLRAGQRARPQVRRRHVRRRDRWLRRAQLLRPRGGPQRDGARRAPRRQVRDPRDLAAAEGAALYFYKAWFDGLVPFIGKFAGEDSAYTYLPNSVKRFATPERTGGRAARRRHDATSRWIALAGGIVTIHHGDRRLTASASR